MPDLLERLTNSYHAEPGRIEPRFSRKTKRVTLTVHMSEIPIEVLISIENLDRAIDRVCNFADGSSTVQMLLDELLHARQKFAHIIDGRKKARGIQIERKAITYQLQYASAWTYCFIRYQWKQHPETRNRFLQDAEFRFLQWLPEESRMTEWETVKRSRRIRLFTAFLVGDAYGHERRQYRLIDPLENFEKFHADSFYRTYVQPKLKHVESRVSKRPHLLDFLSNAYLREVFYPQPLGK